jgi:ABC-2 type transport system permease protein
VTVTVAAHPPLAAPRPPWIDVRGMLRSEWTKLRSVRSTMWGLLLLVALSLGFTTVLLALTLSQWDQATATQQQSFLANPGRSIFGAGLQFSQLVVCVLGVLVITNEYSSGTIRATLLAVPRRTPVLAAKAAVFFVVVFVVGELAALPSFFIGAAILHHRVAVSLGDPGVLRAMIGSGLYLAVLGVFALALGALIRHTAGAITGIIGFVLVLAPLTQLLPGSVGRHLNAYLPSEAGALVVSPRQGPTDLLTPWQGFGVFCVWTAALLLLAMYALERRDA